MYNRKMAIDVRNLASAFSGSAGIEGMASAFGAAGISFIPGFGSAGTVIGVILGAISWADSTTWSTVSSKMANKIDEGKYNLTIDINAWNMDVQVYES